MAFNLNLTLKKKNDEKGSNKKGGKIIEDVRVFIVLMAIACVALIVMSVFGVKSANKTTAAIELQKTEYSKNQLAIANLKALQSKSAEYEALRDRYAALIPNTTLDQQKIMIEMDERCEEGNCLLTDIQFGDFATGDGVSQLPVTLSVTGTFNDIMTLCQKIVTDQEYMRIDAISMSSSEATASASQTNTAAAKKTNSTKTVQITVVKFAKG